jgi:hypothetical protein
MSDHKPKWRILEQEWACKMPDCTAPHNSFSVVIKALVLSLA